VENGDRVRVVLVGSGAVRANPKRGGPCQLIEVPGARIVVDCGRCAVANLARFGCPAESVTHALVTHLHFDHVCDLPYLLLLSWNNGRPKALPVFGPSGTAAFLEHAVRQAYRIDIASRTAHGKPVEGLEWAVTELADTGEAARIGDAVVACLRTPHAGLLNLNYRIDASGVRVVVTSDTQPSPALVDFCGGADLLVCECSGTSDFLADKPWGGWHMTPETVADLVGKAGIRRVVLKHFVVEDFPGGEGVPERMAEFISRETGVPTIAGWDGWTWTA